MKLKSLKLWAVISGSLVGAATIAGFYKHKHKNDSNNELFDFSRRGWRRSLLEARDALSEKNIGMLSAGIAYFGVLAFFPLMASVVAIASIAVQPDKIQEIAISTSQYIPEDINRLLVTQLENATGKPASNVLVATVGIVLSIISVAGATGNMMNALNVMYGIKESRSFIMQKVTSMVLTTGLIVTMIAVVPLLFTGPEFLKWLGLPHLFVDIFSWIRWLLLAALMMFGLALLYHFGPSRDLNTKWQWMSWGAVIATNIWVLGSGLFFIYLQHFANFSNSYSLFAGLIALMIWLNLSSFIVLLGAEINHRLEKRSMRSATK